MPKKTNIKFRHCLYNSNSECYQVSTISLKSLCKEEQKEEMFIFAVITTPTPTPTPTQQKSSTLLPTKYQEFQYVFNKDKVESLPKHQPYDCPIVLKPGKYQLCKPIYNLSQIELKVFVTLLVKIQQVDLFVIPSLPVVHQYFLSRRKRNLFTWS